MAPQSDSRPTNACRLCGAPVTPSFARVFGDNEDRVFGCLRCTSSAERGNLANVGAQLVGALEG